MDARLQDRELLRSTLGGFLDSVGLLLHPNTLRQVMRRMGNRLGRQAAEYYRLTRGATARFSRKDYVQCLRSLNELWGWQFAVLDETPDSVSVSIPTCPFGVVASRDGSLCQLTSGLLGGIASERFGYAKVCGKRGAGERPQHCVIKVYIRETSESRTADGETYPEFDEGLGALLPPLQVEPLPPQTPASLHRLSRRECEVLRLIGEGMSDKEVAATLILSARTVANHGARIRAKLGLSGRAGLVRFALTHHLCPL